MTEKEQKKLEQLLEVMSGNIAQHQQIIANILKATATNSQEIEKIKLQLFINKKNN